MYILLRTFETTTRPPGKLLAVIPGASGNKRPYEISRFSTIALYTSPFLSAEHNHITIRVFGGRGVRPFRFFPHKRRAASDGRARLSSSSSLSCPSPANECDDARPCLQLRRRRRRTKDVMQIVGGGGGSCVRVSYAIRPLTI